ncbi:hypothetical protein [Chitinophaga vietnamensis]|uniref:hypothetical protein n=1 Tax=Chitinophaga vietnamensis TaxID=2593957 RepID=UPI0013759840|nr:hypothetical protein [Chitinophaga vietnamensis]
MKRLFVLIALAFPLILNAQSKLTQAIMDDFSARAAYHYQQPHDSIMGYIAEQMNRSGAGGLDIDSTIFNLKKDPAALDAALKYLYQYSDCNRQRFIANLRSMNVQSANVFPIATYTANKYKNDTKSLLEDKADFLKTYTGPQTGKSPAIAAAPAATATSATSATPDAASAATTTGATPAAAPAAAPTPTDTRNWEVRPIFQARNADQLAEMFGKENISVREATDLAGNNSGDAYVIYPDTDNELEVQFDGDRGNILTFSHEHSKWKSPFGIKAGDPLDKLIKVNGRPFVINGFEWADGGIVSSWNGGALEGKGVTILLKANNTGDPKQYDQVTGGKKIRSDLPVLKKLDVVIQSVAFKSN